MKNKIENDVRSVLSMMIWTGNTATINEQLPRDLYSRVNKILEIAGGKWDRKSKRHIFDDDGEQKIADALEIGEILDHKKEYQFYETPCDLADRMVQLLRVDAHHCVLEPSFGRGALIGALHRAGFPFGRIIGIEKMPENYDEAVKWLPGNNLYCADFLEATPAIMALHRTTGFERIIMNPPFRCGQDVEHVTEAYSVLTKGGILVAITSPSWKFRSGKKYSDFRELVKSSSDFIEDLSAGTFKESGTNVRTTLLILRK